MYKPMDIVAVYGETCMGATVNDKHPPAPDNTTLLQSEGSIDAVRESLARFHLCEVRRVIPVEHGFGLVVSKLTNGDQLFLVHERQVRLVERDGKKIESRPAKYIATFWNDKNENGDYATYDNLTMIQSWLTDRIEDVREELDEDEEVEDFYGHKVFKGIDITNEVSL